MNMDRSDEDDQSPSCGISRRGRLLKTPRKFSDFKDPSKLQIKFIGQPLLKSTSASQRSTRHKVDKEKLNPTQYDHDDDDDSDHSSDEKSSMCLRSRSMNSMKNMRKSVYLRERASKHVTKAYQKKKSVGRPRPYKRALSAPVSYREKSSNTQFKEAFPIPKHKLHASEIDAVTPARPGCSTRGPNKSTYLSDVEQKHLSINSEEHLPETVEFDQYKFCTNDIFNMAAHFKLLGENLSNLGERLQQPEMEVLSVPTGFNPLELLLDGLLCSLGPLVYLTTHIEELEKDEKMEKNLQRIMDNIAYIIPGM